jgi:serine/threonine-protein kinase
MAAEAPPQLRVLRPGTVFHERYEVLRPVAAGGMGAVYEVRHLATRRRRALKVMLPAFVADAGLRARFKQEAIVTSEIESEHLIEIFDADVDPETGMPYIAMELLNGEDLAQRIERRGKLSAPEAVELLAQAASALDKAHAAGVVHRDLKPENLFVTLREDGKPRLKILDFGIAKILESGPNGKTTHALGTPLYMAPEQIEGKGVGPAVDVYALGHIAFALLVGGAYWEPEHDAAPAPFPFMARVLQGLPEPATARAARHRVTLPATFDAWFEQATARDPAARFVPPSRLVERLAQALDVPMPRTSRHELEQVSTVRPPAESIATSAAGSDPPETERGARPEPATTPSGKALLRTLPTPGPFASDHAKPKPRARRLAAAVGLAAAAAAGASVWHGTRKAAPPAHESATVAPDAPAGVARPAQASPPPLEPLSPSASPSDAPAASASAAQPEPSGGASAARNPARRKRGVASAAPAPTSGASSPPEPPDRVGF